MECNEFASDKRSPQTQVLASCRCVDDFAKDGQFQNLSETSLRLPVAYSTMVCDEVTLDIWHTVWC
jgi:hypothetical protein